MSIESEVRKVAQEEAETAVAGHELEYHDDTDPPPPPPPPKTELPAAWKHGARIINNGADGEWDKRLDGAINPCAIVEHRGRLLLYYVGGSGDRTTDGKIAWRALGVAISNDGGRTFEKSQENPIVTHFPSNNQEEGVYSCAAASDGNRVWLWYTAITAADGTSTTESVNTDIYLATSEHGVIFDEGRKVLDHNDRNVWGNGDELFAADWARTPDGLTRVFYMAVSGRVNRQLGFAQGLTPATISDQTAGPILPTQEVWSAHVGGAYMFIDNHVTGKVDVHLMDGANPASREPVKRYDAPGEHTLVYYNTARESWIMLYLDEDRSEIHEMVPDAGGGNGGNGTTKPCQASGGWKYVNEGGCVELGGYVMNTGSRRTADRGNGIFWIGQNNDTFTQADERFWRRGRVTFGAFLERGMVQDAGGGEHFWEHQSYVLQRGGRERDEAHARFVRVETANVSTRSRMVAHGRIDGDDHKSVQLAKWDTVAPEEEWFDVEIDYDHAETGRLVYAVTMLGETYEADLVVDADPIGRYFMPLGHVDGHPNDAGVRFRDLAFRER